MKSNLAPLMKSEKQDWGTPWSVVRALEAIYGPFNLDVCATYDNHKAPAWYGQQSAFGDCFVDGLTQPWNPTQYFVRKGVEFDAKLLSTPGAVMILEQSTDVQPIPVNAFLNPPYDRCADWMEKAYLESQRGATVVCLIPARTDTRYWHDYCMKASEILLVKGRIRFEGATASAPFPSAVVVFRPGENVPVFKSWSVPK